MVTVMSISKNPEDAVYSVMGSELEIDPEGRVWRIAARRADRWTGGTRLVPCDRRRAENRAGDYLQVRVMMDGTRHAPMAHRLVYRHFNGPIPPGMTVNHINGTKDDNRPSNLELASYSEQVVHARQVLRRGRLDQGGTKNAMAKLTPEAVDDIRKRRVAGERLRSIAKSHGISDRTVSKIALGLRWASPG